MIRFDKRSGTCTKLKSVLAAESRLDSICGVWGGGGGRGRAEPDGYFFGGMIGRLTDWLALDETTPRCKREHDIEEIWRQEMLVCIVASRYRCLLVEGPAPVSLFPEKIRRSIQTPKWHVRNIKHRAR